MREPPPLHGTIIGNGLVVLLTPAYEASADFGNSFALWANTSSSLHPQAAPSSALSSSRSEEWRTPTLHFGSVSVSPSVQRLLSGIVLVPAIMSSIWYAPQEAVLLLISIGTTVGSYEFSWLAFRIIQRIEALFKYYDGQPNSEDPQSIHSSRASNGSARDEEEEFEPVVIDSQQCVVTPIAKVLFYRGNQWLAALILALPTSMIFVGIDGKALSLVRPTNQSLDTFVWAYLIPTRYVTALCGWFAPNWTWMVLILWQSEVFSVMAILVQHCPIAVFTCTDNTNSNYLFTVFVVGYIVILLICAITSAERALVVQATLAITGFSVVHGLGLSIVGLLDVSDPERSRSIFTLLLTIFWAAQTSAYVWKRLAAPWWGHSTPLCTRISTQLDMESLLVAIGVGVCVTILVLHFNSLSGGESAGVYSLLAALGIICMQVGEIVTELWGRAAGVRHTGRSLPGGRGLLERTTVLIFGVIVFLPYLATQSKT
ncbi:hypothetical protein PC116_g17113 [Phytophthora cactorum]|uniref:Uncharacterized protein n=2 Tax=Phytophthora cactorum TaxID=29920 RepID=A0A329RYE5_9STRA|nr:hypothetical protein Pcac1_g5919 [Phytophthora cactorum]KAG2816650.1 hypothetical protein PC111_g13063 [Phytophthora cactorum]KAG2817351.1 hypothetical protein PC112_g13107 [Phytophthora cactorum]KAG2853249.1 hypothetical protein PC113_g14340 [Phytophthora cactorum]KAG2896032.1 hypothetical protein PC114_g15278 [Phytophthora cactorum]